MPEFYYREALKLGQREMRACAAKGLSPTLPNLDDLLEYENGKSRTDLGVQMIPAELIVGTRARSRSLSFARNFMPLLEEGTEFAYKWQHLCQSHVKEGIREPVKVWEYLNRYYVEEGNKRVSVLKFFGASSVAAEVTRILPKKNGDVNVELYYELVEFQRYSQINTLEFSRKGAYAEFQKLTGKAPSEPWTEEERAAFTGTLYFFRSAFESLGGKKLAVTPGDALLACMRIYGYQELLNRSITEMRALISRAWEEIKLMEQPQPVDVRLTSADEKKPSVLNRVLLSQSARPLRAAFIHDKTPETSGWTNGHELGREYVERVFGDRIQTKAYFNALEDDPEAVIQKAISDGNTVLFTTSPRLLPASLRCAAKHSEIAILNCSLNMAHRYVRSYYARMYEAKFIIGAIAGALAGREDVGYIADYPIYGQIAGINAFAFGVEMVNPQAKVHLEWSGTDSAEAALDRLKQKGIRLVSAQDQNRLHNQGRSSFGLSLLHEDTETMLAMPVWEWGVYYEKLLRRIQDRSLQEEYNGSSRALNYYWGMREGVVSLGCSEKLPEGVRRLTRVLKQSVLSGQCDPFGGALYDQENRKRIEPQASISVEQIIAMDWLGRNIEGRIPPYEALTETGKATVDMVGVLRNAEAQKT